MSTYGWGDRSVWERERLEIRRHLWTLLGDLPPLFTPELIVTSSVGHVGYVQHHFTFDNEAGATVYGLLLIPDGLTRPAPAVLWNHAHGHRYDTGAARMITPHHIHGHADGIELVRRGCVVMAIDAYAFGERTHQGAAGGREGGADTEMSLFKQFLWQGRTLWGMMVRDDLMALDALIAHPAVDPARVGTVGMSLGGSRATWVAAMDDRVALTIPIGQMTRYADLLAAGALSFHSIYYFVPSMLKAGLDMEHIVALTAPRRQIILVGDSDPGSPLAGITTVRRYVESVYGLYGAADHLDVTIYPGIAHAYTPDMHDAMIAAAVRHLNSES
ncbi:MAG: acetylxylan esterase [Chloroflexota bacterium]|nr:acetylxylan esterase [Chloroflexota bacterium]